MNSREKIVNLIIKRNWQEFVGGCENGIMDKDLDEMPSDDEIVDTVYHLVIDTKQICVRGGWLVVSKDIRFLGKEKIMGMVIEFHQANK